MKIKIDYKYATLNEYINAERSNKYYAAKMKKLQTDVSRAFFITKDKIKNPVDITFTWHLMNKRRDPDNICFAKKFILDGMVTAKFIENDNLKWIKSFKDYFVVETDIKNEYVEVELIESEE